MRSSTSVFMLHAGLIAPYTFTSDVRTHALPQQQQQQQQQQQPGLLSFRVTDAAIICATEYLLPNHDRFSTYYLLSVLIYTTGSFHLLLAFPGVSTFVRSCFIRGQFPPRFSTSCCDALLLFVRFPGISMNFCNGVLPRLAPTCPDQLCQLRSYHQPSIAGEQSNQNKCGVSASIGGYMFYSIYRGYWLLCSPVVAGARSGTTTEYSTVRCACWAYMMPLHCSSATPLSSAARAASCGPML